MGVSSRLHFHTELRRAKAERAHASEDVRAAIGSFGAAVGGVALGFEDALHEPRQAVTGKLGLNHHGDPVQAFLLQVDHLGVELDRPPLRRLEPWF
jgi:hypothetical protein